MVFGDYLKNLRKEKKLSQRQLAELAGISNTEISRLESGDRLNPSPKILKALAPHLEISYGVLLKEAGYIDELSDNDNFTVDNINSADYNLQNIYKELNNIKDPEFIKLMIKASNELPNEDLKMIKDLTSLLLNKIPKEFKSYISYIDAK